ncbi:response regulator [Aquimarina sp. U1-2]|uniref:response regulator n=1 Tax=Aquimarina sp. U1-2 TaxID=2823141 RepID=UPI001AEC8EC5|nr:response regulator [Aquimarina sp. U1-2]MBP2832917.1 response regulator [Aquimarina sp. U1-2]
MKEIQTFNIEKDNLPIRILIIEDNKTDIELIRRIVLKNFPLAQVEISTDLKEITFVIQQEAVDIILADYNLRKFNASDVLVELKNSCSTIPCVIISGALKQQQLISNLLYEGAKDVIIKDNYTILKQRLGKVLTELRTHLLERSSQDHMELEVLKALDVLELQTEKLIMMEADDKKRQQLKTLDFEFLKNAASFYIRSTHKN